ncbi:MAG: 3'(2'),5'-bisphosphate nucleotidase CysQ, partial [Chloroflexi bacterium]|nr:3'(2'),5'-bisphosphate nucleotidase CysQ [Chloroflexota bacterium]
MIAKKEIPLPPVLGLREEVSEVLPLVLESGRIALRYYTPDMQVDYKGKDDPVTQADREINAYIVDHLRRRFPQDGILAEESADRPEERLSRRRLWCIDPLDGTREFTERVDQWCIMVGLAVAGTATFGVVYSPSTDVLMVGLVSEGAWLWDGNRWHTLRVSDVRDPREATIAVSRSHRSDLLDEIIRSLGIRREIRHGSVGMKISLLAQRRADLYIHPTPGTKEWDLCAPEAILHAAGGQMTDMYGRPFR